MHILVVTFPYACAFFLRSSLWSGLLLILLISVSMRDTGPKTMPSNSDWDGLHRRGNGCDDTKSEVIGELVLKHSFVEENGY